MVCRGCGGWLTVIRFPAEFVSGAMVRCVFCGWRSTWIEGKVKSLTPAARRREAAKLAEAKLEEGTL